VLVARMLEGMLFLLGPTMAVRRSCVEEIGGFKALGAYCADDFVLGNWIAANGHEVVLSRHVVDHAVLNTGFWGSMKHQMRWMKSTRWSRPKGHLGTLLTFGIPFAILSSVLLLLRERPWLALGAVAWGILTRVVLAAVVGGLIVQERNLLRTVLIYPLRDLIGFASWLASYANNRIWWRGEEYELLKGGRMRPFRPSDESESRPLTQDEEPAFYL
jgi:ceramide glucosyltransferase